jgi:hypothetical protein
MKKIFLIAALFISIVSQGQGDGLFKNMTIQQKFTLNGYYVNYIKNDTSSWSTGTRFLPTSKAVYDFVVGRVGSFPTGSGASNRIAYWSNTNSLTSLAVNSTSTRKFLTQISSGVPAWNILAAGDLPIVVTNKGIETATWTGTSLNIPKDQRVGYYINIGKTFLDKPPIVFGKKFIFTPASWASGNYSLGTFWGDQICSYFGKTKVLRTADGYEMQYAIQLNWENTIGNHPYDSITFLNPTFGVLFNSIATGLPYAGAYYFGEPVRNDSKTFEYAKAAYRTFIANYYLDKDGYALSTLTHTGFRTEVALDSVGSKTGVALKGVGSITGTKPVGKTSLVFPIWNYDSVRIHGGTITVTLAGDTVYNRYMNGLNNCNKGLSDLLKRGLAYDVIVLQNLPDTAQSFTISVSGDSSWVDGVYYLISKNKATKPLYINNIPYGGAPTWFTWDRRVIDTTNLIIQDAVDEFHSQGYPVWIENTANWFDSTTSVQTSTFHYTSAGNDSVAGAYIRNLIPLKYVPQIDDGIIESTYTPTLTNTTNISASTPDVAHFIKTGSYVHVWGECTIDATAATTITEMQMSLPFSSVFTNTYQLAGTASFEDNTSVQICANTSTGNAKWRFTPQTATNNKYSFRLSYKIYTP